MTNFAITGSRTRKFKYKLYGIGLGFYESGGYSMTTIFGIKTNAEDDFSEEQAIIIAADRQITGVDESGNAVTKEASESKIKVVKRHYALAHAGIVDKYLKHFFVYLNGGKFERFINNIGGADARREESSLDYLAHIFHGQVTNRTNDITQDPPEIGLSPLERSFFEFIEEREEIMKNGKRSEMLVDNSRFHLHLSDDVQNVFPLLILLVQQRILNDEVCFGSNEYCRIACFHCYPYFFVIFIILFNNYA